jgi:phosphoribosylamine--glycine ligase
LLSRVADCDFLQIEKTKMKILVTGNGGREHALAWKFAQSPSVEIVYLAPGNAGSGLDAGLENVAIDVMDFEGQIEFALENEIDLTMIGPEAPLVAGVVDQFQAAGLVCFGPSMAAAQLEGSKIFTKDFLQKYSIPTAKYGSFDSPEAALSYLKTITLPIVLKADGLAAGKGVVIAQTLEEAETTVREMMQENSFGSAGQRVVIEEFLAGEEASFIVIADGKVAIPFATSQDHKAIYDGDKGPNTGGMGAYSPAPVVTDEIHAKVMEQVIEPTLAGMAEEGHPYVGFLYAGLMIDEDDNVNVIEFNCRFGDPETQPIMMRMKDNLSDLCLSAIGGTLEGQSLNFEENIAIAVVMASEGYPGDYKTGFEISGIEHADQFGKVFHAGTKVVDGKLVTAGGRVLGVTAMGTSVSEAQSTAYKMIDQIHYDGATYRHDIGYRAIEREISVVDT